MKLRLGRGGRRVCRETRSTAVRCIRSMQDTAHRKSYPLSRSRDLGSNEPLLGTRMPHLLVAAPLLRRRALKDRDRLHGRQQHATGCCFRRLAVCLHPRCYIPLSFCSTGKLVLLTLETEPGWPAAQCPRPLPCLPTAAQVLTTDLPELLRSLKVTACAPAPALWESNIAI